MTAGDPLEERTAPLDHRLAFPLLGVPLELQSNSAAVLEIAREAFSSWDDLPPGLVEPRPPLALKVVVNGECRPDSSAQVFDYRRHGGQLLASSEGVMLQAWRGVGALAFVTKEVVARRKRFQRNVLECMALFLASHRDRTPIHAAVLVFGPRALLISGRSGAGKSTLAYGLHRSGYRLLAEDAVYVERDRGMRLWGNPAGFNLSPDNSRWFPELAHEPVTVQANGKKKINLTIRGGAGETELLQTFCGEIIVCRLERQHGEAASLEPMTASGAAHALGHRPEPGFDIAADLDHVVEDLARCPAYVLRVSKDPRQSLSLLRELIE